ncbi:unnamed protein product, partial [Rotaria socialis]
QKRRSESIASTGRNESIASTGRSDELTKIFEQATHLSQHRASSASISKRPSHAHEEAYEEMTWDTLVPGIIPAAPPLPGQWQKATENLHHPQEVSKQPASIAESNRTSDVGNLHDIITAINQHSRERTYPSFPQETILTSQIHSRPSTASRSQNDFDDDDDDDNDIQIRNSSSMYAIIPPRQHSQQVSRADSVQTNTSSSTARRSIIAPIINTYQPQASIVSTLQQQQQ